ncbi:nuclear transport factor 2 family protein [Siccirubricoccus phaeus]|uniref:nuclear transport factor 2 family protein n=1 Tax=Siccirubricoccus phaeus TaxID=2595053 RepID=UPI0011F09E0E|nr:nuclear transport factor 2 family protein [Siccirubricoccus phaeus]
MSTHDALIDRYIACWNEADPARRRALIAETFAEGATYLDPLHAAEGQEGIAALIEGAQRQFPGLAFSRRGGADAHHDRLRFAWALGPAGGEAVAGGTDVGRLAVDGRFASVLGFIDFAPKG